MERYPEASGAFVLVDRSVGESRPTGCRGRTSKNAPYQEHHRLAHALHAAPGRVELSSSSPRRILVVEDDPDALDLYELSLEQDGWAVATAKTLAEARARIAGKTPDVVLLDCCLPDGSGMELLSEWRGSTPMASVPVVIVTAFADAAREAEGVAALLVKPCTPSSLTRALEKVLEATRPTEPPPPSSQTAATIARDLFSCVSSPAGALLYQLGLDRVQARCDKCLRASPIFYGTPDDASIHLAALDWGMNADGQFACADCRHKTAPHV